ncbi:MAG: histone H1 [Balneolaceae bacterium]
MNRIDQIQSLIADLEPEMNKFYEKGNKAAGTRARKQLQEIKKVSQEIRIEIQEMKNSGQV